MDRHRDILGINDELKDRILHEYKPSKKDEDFKKEL